MRKDSGIDLASRYSDSCTRTGIAALAAAAACFTISQRLAAVKPLEAYGAYVLARETLDAGLEEWKASEFSPRITEFLHESDHPGSLRLSQLNDVECIQSSDGIQVQSKTPTVIEPKPHAWLLSLSSEAHAAPSGTTNGMLQQPKSAAVTPMAPMQLRISLPIPCPGLSEILSALTHLSDEDTIAKARRLSSKVDVELWRWQLKWNRIIATQESHFPKTIGHIPQAAYFKFTIDSLKELNEYPRTTVAEFATTVNERTSISVPYAPIVQSANSAGLLAQFATLIIVAYFALNISAARRRGVLQAPGSLFATLSINYGARQFLVFMTTLPAGAAIYLAVNMAGVEQFVGFVTATVTFSITCGLVFLFWRTWRL